MEMITLGKFTFKNGFLIVKSPVFCAANFARDHGLELTKKGIKMPDDEKKYGEICDILLQAGYVFV